jgi:hypothetical protein
LTPEGFAVFSTLNLDQAMKPGAPYQKNPDHEKEYRADELKQTLQKTFRRVDLYGLHYRWKHCLMKRFKKWGLERNLPAPVNFVRNHFQHVTVHDFYVSRHGLSRSVDLVAVCGK